MSICWRAGRRARRSVWRAREKAWTTTEASLRGSTSICFTTSTRSGGLMNDHRQSPSGKMFAACSTRKTTPSAASSAGCWGAMKPLKLKTASGLKQAFSVARPSEWVGESWTPGSMPWLKGVGEYFSVPCRVNLSSVLEQGPVHPEYYLSAKACSGNLRRAERAGKRLPKPLVTALQAGAQEERATDRLAEPPRSLPSAAMPKGANSRPAAGTPASRTL